MARKEICTPLVVTAEPERCGVLVRANTADDIASKEPVSLDPDLPVLHRAAHRRKLDDVSARAWGGFKGVKVRLGHFTFTLAFVRDFVRRGFTQLAESSPAVCRA